MKLNNKFWGAMLCIATCCGIYSCQKNTVAPNGGDADDSGFCTLNLGWAGEIISVTEEPLRKSDETSDLYGIQVYSTPNKELENGVNPTWTKYAYGVFDMGDNINIKLIKGYKYKFEATMVTDGKNVIHDENVGRYEEPFYAWGENQGRSTITNSFTYHSTTYLHVYNPRAYTWNADHTGCNMYNHAKVERFYGELLDYTPGINNSKEYIKMKRVCFGAKFVVKGALANEGTLQISMNDAEEILIDLSSEEKMHSDIYTFQNVLDAYKYDDYNETVQTTINWNKPDGTVIPLGTHNIKFKRNKMSVVNIELDNNQGLGNIGVIVDDIEMEEDDEETTIKDGEIADTNINNKE